MTSDKQKSVFSSKVYFVDDDKIFLGLASQLLRQAGFDVITYLSAAELLDDLTPDSKGCILSDLNMPNMDGLALQSAVQQSINPLPIVFLTGAGCIPSSVNAMRHGAEDFLIKGTPKKDLIDAIKQAFSRNKAERAARARKSKLRTKLALLSNREREVLEHVVQGKLNKQIADDLGIHERTVKLHRTSITTKLGLPSVAELTKFWMEAGFSTDKRNVIQNLRRVICALMLGGMSQPISAATVTWDAGGNTNNWRGNGASGANNWNPNSTPVNGDALIFAGTNKLSNNNNIVGGLSIINLTFASGAGAFVLGGNQLRFTAGGITNSSSNLQTISMALGLNATITVASTAGSVALGGIVSGTGGITKTGANTLLITNANTYTGITTITTGLISANNTTGSATGTGAVAVSAAGALGGTGTIAPSGNKGITVSSGGLIAPGNGTTPGTLSINLGGTSGKLTMSTGSGFQYHLGSAGIGDMLAIVGAAAGDVAFNNNMINFMGTGAVGSYKIFDTSLNSTTWTGLTVNGSGQITAGLSYSNLTGGYSAILYMGGMSYGGDAGDIYVRVIPEPKVALLGGLGVLLLLRRRRF